MLANSLQCNNLPHLLFYGPPGTGKTSTILALAHELFGPELYKSRVLELNASDERGIQVIREKVKNFARGTANKTVNGYPCPPFKIIILDEADSMTIDAQSALRRMMETYSKVTRFCLVCNYVSRIIEPLTSRCAKFRFNSLNYAEIVSRLTFVAEQEQVDVQDEQALKKIVEISEGDLRKALMFLQSASKITKSITLDTVISISGNIPCDFINEFLEICRRDNFDQIQSFVNGKIILNGYSASQFIAQLLQVVIKSSSLNNVEKSAISIKIGQIDKCLNEGSDEFLQLMDLGGFIFKHLHLKEPITLIE